METRDVVIAGGGPVGLMLACELRRCGVDVLVLERLAEPSETIKAGSVNGRSVQALERIGLGAAIAAVQREATERMKTFMAERVAAAQPAGPAGGAGGAAGPAGEAGGAGGPAGEAGGAGGPAGGASGAGGPAGEAGGAGGPAGGAGGAGGPAGEAGGAGGAGGGGRRWVPKGHFAGIFKVGFGTEELAGALEVLTVRPRGLLAAGVAALPRAGAPMVMIPQVELERLLAARAAELGVEIRRGRTVADLDGTGRDVAVLVAGPGGDELVRARWLVGCDGGRSAVRKLAGFEFPGTAPTLTGHQAVVELDDPGKLATGWHRTDEGLIVYGPFPGRVLTVEFDGPPPERDAPVTAGELEASIQRVSGTDVRVTAVRTATRFTDNARLADGYRRGRVLLAGDAAHVHSPFGGQGLNLGLQDAANLGWKLAAVLAGRQPVEFLNSYTAERHPVAEQVLDNTRAQIALLRPDPQSDALRQLFTDLMDLEQVNWHLTEMMSGIGTRYGDLPAGAHPLTGHHHPDLDLPADTWDGRALLVDPTADPDLTKTAAAWPDQVKVITAPTGDGVGALLIRPDGYLAWVSGDRPADPDTLRAALVTWFGPAAREV